VEKILFLAVTNAFSVGVRREVGLTFPNTGSPSSASGSLTSDEDRTPYFEAFLPIEELARRGRETLRFDPMKSIGLIDSRTDRAALCRGAGGIPEIICNSTNTSLSSSPALLPYRELHCLPFYCTPAAMGALAR